MMNECFYKPKRFHNNIHMLKSRYSFSKNLHLHTYLLSASATSTKYVCVTEDMIPIPWKTRPIHIYITFPLDIPTITQPTSRGKQKTMMVFLRPMAPIEKPMVTEPKSWPILLKLANGVMEESHFLYKIVYV